MKQRLSPSFVTAAIGIFRPMYFHLDAQKDAKLSDLNSVGCVLVCFFKVKKKHITNQNFLLFKLSENCRRNIVDGDQMPAEGLEFQHSDKCLSYGWDFAHGFNLTSQINRPCTHEKVCLR